MPVNPELYAARAATESTIQKDHTILASARSIVENPHDEVAIKTIFEQISLLSEFAAQCVIGMQDQHDAEYVQAALGGLFFTAIGAVVTNFQRDFLDKKPIGLRERGLIAKEVANNWLAQRSRQ